MLRQQSWDSLQVICQKHIQKKHTSYTRAFFYYGIAMYKQGDYVKAITAFEKAEMGDPKNAQLHYNLGLAYFKVAN